MTREQLQGRVDAAWQEFGRSYADLEEKMMMTPGVTGAWSVRDIIAHVTCWEEETLKHLPHIHRGGRQPSYARAYGGIDAFNQLMTEARRNLPLAEVRRQRDEVHARLTDYLSHVPEGLFARETRFRRRLRVDTYGHYPTHARAIRTWREQALEAG